MSSTLKLNKDTNPHLTLQLMKFALNFCLILKNSFLYVLKKVDICNLIKQKNQFRYG